MNGLRNFGEMVGQYWSQDNAAFERTDPTLVRRVLRAVNPATGFGSALGSVYDYVGEGDPIGATAATVSAMPMFAFGRVVKGADLKGPLTKMKYGLRNFGRNAATQAGAMGYDETQR